MFGDGRLAGNSDVHMIVKSMKPAILQAARCAEEPA